MNQSAQQAGQRVFLDKLVQFSFIAIDMLESTRYGTSLRASPGNFGHFTCKDRLLPDEE
jgi:hypothetical protein